MNPGQHYDIISTLCCSIPFRTGACVDLKGILVVIGAPARCPDSRLLDGLIRVRCAIRRRAPENSRLYGQSERIGSDDGGIIRPVR